MTRSSGERKSVGTMIHDLMLARVPAYANSIFYSLGFLTAVSLVLIVISGVVMVFSGPFWWLTSPVGVYVRSVHLWATQALVVFMILHLLIVFLTSGYRTPRRLTWVLGSIALFLALIEAEFGYALRGDFSSQWRSLQAADLYNGAGLGKIINNLNYAQIYGIHVAAIPLAIIAIVVVHYVLVRVRGIAKPYRRNVKARMTHANHNVLFSRGAALAIVILALAFAFRAPMITPTSVEDVAQQAPTLMAHTLIEELNRSSDTATYMDNIQPYTFDTRTIYIERPYEHYIELTNATDEYARFVAEPTAQQRAQIDAAATYFAAGGAINTAPNANPVVPMVSSLVHMGRAGLYQQAIFSSNSRFDPMYSTRFLADTGVLDRQAEALKITTDQYGMVREESGALPPGAWWLAPLGVLDHTLLRTDPNQDRDGAEIIGIFFLLMVAFPYIPYLNRLPELIGADRLIWKSGRKE